MNPWTRWFGAIVVGVGSSTVVTAETPNPSGIPLGEAKPSPMAKAAEALRANKVQPASAKVQTESVKPVGALEPSPLAGTGVEEPVHLHNRYRPDIFAVETEVLRWKYRGTTLPSLITSGSAADAVPGALGQPGTNLLFGDRFVHQDLRNGGRVRLYTMEDDNYLSWDVSAFFLDPQTTSFTASSNQVPVLARPYYDARANTEGSFLLGFPGAFAGGVHASLDTNFFGVEANGALSTPDGNHMGFVGFRFAQLNEQLSVRAAYRVLPNGLSFINGVTVLPEARGLMDESISAHTNFYGGQIGWRNHFGYRGFGLDLRGSLAAGASVSTVRINGGTYVRDASGIYYASSGLLAQPSNRGQHDDANFAIMPEVSARLSYAFTHWFSMYAGYDVLYWSSVIRATNQVDRVVDTTAMPASANYVGGVGRRPFYQGNDSTFWAHGFNIGMRFQY